MLPEDSRKDNSKIIQGPWSKKQQQKMSFSQGILSSLKDLYKKLSLMYFQNYPADINIYASQKQYEIYTEI